MAFVDIELDMDALAKISAVARAAALETAEAVKTDIIASQTMPFDQGNLQNGGTYSHTRKDGTTVAGATVKGLDVVDVSEGENARALLCVDGPQARRLYFHPEYNFQKVNNPNAGAGWFDPYTKGGSKEDFVPEAFATCMKEHLK